MARNRPLRVLVTHPAEWATGGYAGRYGCEVRRVSIGGIVPRRPEEAGGIPTFDGRGEVATEEGIKTLVKVAAEFKPDVFMFTIHFGFGLEQIESIRKASPGVYVAMHYADQRDFVARHVSAVAAGLDLLLVNNEDPQDWKKYEKLGLKVDTLHDAASPREYYPCDASGPACDVFFDGNNFWPVAEHFRKRPCSVPWWVEELYQFTGMKFRNDLMCEVNKAFKLAIRGSVGWDAVEYDVQPMVYHPALLGEIRRGHIVLGTNNLPKTRGYMRRQFRAMMSGRLYMSEWLPGIERDFENHRDLVWFTSIPEALDLIRHYIENGSEREAIARRGRELAAVNHSYERRLAEFAGIMRRRLGS